MKRLILILSFGFGQMLSHAQSLQADSWKIKWNKKVILETGKVSETANVRVIKKTDIDKNSCLEVIYKESTAQQEKEWNRSILFFDDADKELLRKDSTRNVKLRGAELEKLFGDKKKIRIYTLAIPTDPDVAARVRVRRVHLCTLELQ